MKKEEFLEKERIRLREYIKNPKVKERRRKLYLEKYKNRNEVRRITERYILNKLKEKCGICSSVENLHIHHWRYDKPLCYSILCRKCHNIIHSK